MPVAPPDEEEVKKATATLKKVYAARYAAKDDHGKAVLARMMLKHAEWHRMEPALAMALLRESVRLATEGKDYPGALTAIDHLEAAFTGVMVNEERRKAFQKSTSRVFTVALLKLIDTPDDVRSCVVAGRWLGPVAGRWQEALPVLVRATEDAPIQALAAKESEPMAMPAEIAQAAQGWMDLAAKTTNLEERGGMQKHALALFQRASTGLQGIEQEKAKQSIAALQAKIPLDLEKIDWAAITAAEWEHLPGTAIPVVGKVDRTDTSIVLKEGESVRVVPHPTETWNFALTDNSAVTPDWKGVERTVSILINDPQNGGTRTLIHRCGAQGHLYGAMLMWTDVNRKLRAGVITGPGKVFFGPSSDRMGEKSVTGALRVKIVAVDE
jgi:hypothetical protein